MYLAIGAIVVVVVERAGKGGVGGAGGGQEKGEREFLGGAESAAGQEHQDARGVLRMLQGQGVRRGDVNGVGFGGIGELDIEGGLD